MQQSTFTLINLFDFISDLKGNQDKDYSCFQSKDDKAQRNCMTCCRSHSRAGAKSPEPIACTTPHPRSRCPQYSHIGSWGFSWEWELSGTKEHSLEN